MKDEFVRIALQECGVGRKKAEYLWAAGFRYTAGLPRAEQHQGEPVARYSMDQTGCEELDPDGHWVRYDDMKHADPAEVERLLGKIETMRRKNNEYWHETEALRAQLANKQTMSDNYCALLMDANAQLAERDALLKCWMTFPLSASSPKINEVRRKSDYLLSASAESSAPKCGVCGQGAWACNEGGCHYLESGNGAPVEIDERAAFERAIRTDWPTAPISRKRDLLPKDDPCYGNYCDEPLQRAWVGWQARAALERMP